LYHLGVSQFGLSQYRASINTLSQEIELLKEVPGSGLIAHSHEYLAHSYMAMHDYVPAITALQKATDEFALDPVENEAALVQMQYLKAKCYYAMRRPDKAKSVLLSILQESPRYQVKQSMQYIQEAKELLARLDPTNSKR
jgi:tetratricopeptide (TPR) repeat protein